MGVVGARPAGWIAAVAGTTLVQAVLALLIRTQPLLGAPLTEAAGVPPASVGLLSSAASLGSTIFFLWGTSALAAMDSVRQLRAGCVLAAGAILLCLSSSWSLMLVAAFLIGIGYGPSAPAGSDILTRVAPPSRRALVFSIKQAGVPLGGFVAGLLLPFALLHGGLAAALAVATAIALLSALTLGWWVQPEHAPAPRAAQPLRPRLDVLAPVLMLRMILGSRQLRALTLSGLGLGAAQGVLLSYYPVFLINEIGLSLAAAGAAYALLQGFSIGGRIVMGWASDAIGSSSVALIALGFASAASMALVAALGPDTGAITLALVSALAGVTVVSWNGVFLAALASLAPQGQVGHITSAGTFVIFMGYVVSPLAMSGVVTATGSYSVGFGLAGLVPAATAAVLMLARKGEPTTGKD
jgi:MFS family permease